MCRGSSVLTRISAVVWIYVGAEEEGAGRGSTNVHKSEAAIDRSDRYFSSSWSRFWGGRDKRERRRRRERQCFIIKFDGGTVCCVHCI